MRALEFFRGFIIMCVLGGTLQVLIFSNLWVPVLIALGVFSIVKGKITDYVYEQVSE